MVRSARLVLAAAALALLAGCGFFMGSIFPDRFLGAEGYADLSGYLDADRRWSYDFKIIRNSSSGDEYLVLVSDDPGFDGVHLVVFSASLRVLGKYTLEQLNGMHASTFEGRGAMVDASGRIVVGNRRFDVSPRAMSFHDVPPTLHGYGLAIPEGANPNLHNIHLEADGTVWLNYDRYESDWSSFAAVGPVNVDCGTWGKIFGLWLGSTEVVALMSYDAVPARIFHLNRTEFADGLLSSPLEFWYPRPDFADYDKIVDRTLGYTAEGFAAYRWDTNQYVLVDASTGTIVDSLDVPDEADRPDGDQRHLYGRGEGWYILDWKELYLERRAWWWK